MTNIGYDIGMSGVDRLVALLNAPILMTEINPATTSFIEVVQSNRSNVNTKITAQINLTKALETAMKAGFRQVPRPVLTRTLYVNRVNGAEIHKQTKMVHFPLGLASGATDAEVLTKLNTLYDLGVDARDVLTIERTSGVSKVVFKVSSITYTGHLKVAITGPII